MKTLFTQIKPDSLSSEQIRTWDQAVANSDLPDPICNEYEWVMSYHTVDGLNRPALMLFEHGNMFSICEHHERDVTILAPLESGWLYDRPFLGADPIPLLFKAIDLLDDYYGQRNFPLMIFGGMSPHKPICNEILLNLGHLFNFYVQSDGCQGAASLEGGIDGFISRRSSNFRSKLKKAVRKTKELGLSYERHIPADPKEAMNIYQRMLAVEEKSWKG
ncbi:MAG: hypothetical protein IJS50_03910, partial [Desulfovibrio sp.]|nr:hypothetical protein [Desulfovibrio sp.]